MVLDRGFLARPALEVAPDLLGALLHHDSPDGEVVLRLTEVEAYHGEADPGSHAFRGRTARNAVMFGPAGQLYAYFTYGMHTCANIVCGAEGAATAVLLRAAEVVAGVELARRRRGAQVADRDLARGPARLTVAAGIRLADTGADLLAPPFLLESATARPPVASGPRVGVAGDGGSEAYPWRFWIPGEPTVSAYRAHAPRRKTGL
ncbi:DNA-3-methyladenine glycosylase [Gryllotalpicola sp.]|uniref:DNA-3-methyladenine glycosylase n=1 Tax=Gryllotalpicola sp. TaxID=1932787 RepID=UPI0026241DB4|nr:DNA-3-methyladenine glycosylase [Gryllotalpicola sp.]